MPTLYESMSVRPAEFCRHDDRAAMRFRCRLEAVKINRKEMSKSRSASSCRAVRRIHQHVRLIYYAPYRFASMRFGIRGMLRA